MATLAGLVLFAAPIGVLVALLMVSERWQAHRRDEVLRQIALTDALHARLGAVVAPVVRWRQRAWRVTVAVPFERPAVVATVLATAAEVFGQTRYEIALSRQTPAVPMPHPPRRATLGQESLSWS
jgi:uncharacterized membrane protein